MLFIKCNLKKRILIILALLTLPLLGQNCDDIIEKEFNTSTPLDFLSFTETLNDTCQNSLIYYCKSQTYMILGAPLLAEQEYKKILKNIKDGKHNIIEYKLDLICFMLMEENRRINNKAEFNKWKEEANLYIDKKCATGRSQKIKNVYYIMLQRFELSNDKKNEKIYQRKLKKKFYPKSFFKY